MPIASPPDRVGGRNLAWFAAALLLFLGVLLLPTPAGLSAGGHVALALLALVVVLWVSECVSPANSAVVMTALAVLSLIGRGLSPGAPKPLDSSGALTVMLSGFASPAVILVAGALFLAVALKITGLDRRVALLVMSRLGVSPSGLILGALAVGFVLALFIPSATARVGAVIPIMMGMVAALGLPANSALAATLMVVTAQACSVFNIGIKTAAAQNLITLGFMQDGFGHGIAWGSWFLAALPFTLGMCVALFVLARLLLRPEVPAREEAMANLRAQLQALGPMTGRERRLLAVAVLLLLLWSTEGWLHPVDATTATLLGLALLLAPRFGVMHWAEAEKLIPWGTVTLFAAGISLGNLLSRSGAAAWLAKATLGQLGLEAMPVVGMVAALSAFSILLHLGFASATGLASTLIPIVMAFAKTLPVSPQAAFGLVLVQGFVVSFGFVLPANAPQNMLCYGTGAFDTGQFARVGVLATLIGFGLILLLSVTYWPAIGVL